MIQVSTVKPTNSFFYDTMSSLKTNGKALSQRVYDVAVTLFSPISQLHNWIRPKNPLTGERQVVLFPERWEKAIGQYQYRSAIDADGGKWKDDTYVPVINAIMKKIIPYTGRPNLNWKITGIDSASKNAWSMPGGYVAIYKGLIEKMIKNVDKDYGLGAKYGKGLGIEDKLAAVIAHEMAHVGARHSARSNEYYWFMMAAFYPASFVLDGLAFILVEGYFLGRALLDQSYTRSQEYEADRYGMIMMDKAGYDPKAAVWVQCFLKSIEPSYGIRFWDWADRWFWDHPDADHRIEANKITLAEIQTRKAAQAA